MSTLNTTKQPERIQKLHQLIKLDATVVFNVKLTGLTISDLKEKQISSIGGFIQQKTVSALLDDITGVRSTFDK